MTQNSIKNKILNFLADGKWAYGGQIEDHIRSTDGHKASNASRRCRELEDEGKIESRYVTVPGVANKVVQYRFKSFGEVVKTAEDALDRKVRMWNEQFKPKVEPTKNYQKLF